MTSENTSAGEAASQGSSAQTGGTLRRMVRGRPLRIATAVGGTGLLFLAAWKYLSPEVLLGAVENIRPIPLLFALAAYCGVIALRGSRYVILGADLSMGDAFSIAAVHSALLRVMPLRSGELAYGIMLKRMGKGGFGQGLAAVLVLRLLDFAMIAGLAAVSAGVYFSETSQAATILSGLFFAAAVGFLFFAAAPAGRALDRLIAPKLTAEKRPLWVRAIQAISDVLGLTLKRRILLFAATVLLWPMLLTWFYCIMIGIGIDISVADGFSAGMLGVVGSILPLSLVGSFGPFEGGFALGFCAVGYAPEAAAAFALLLSTFSFLQNWIPALPGWIWVLVKSRNTD